MFNKGSELLQLCNDNNKKISEIVIEKELKDSEISYEDLMKKMEDVLEVMKSSSTKALNKEVESVGGLITGNSKKMEEYRRKNKSLSGDLISSSMAMAFSTSEINASMGKIVAAPTAGASGILPSALLSVKEKLDLSDHDLIMGLLNSAGVGEIVAKNATISGAEGGCQAECGVAAAMAASALVELSGGSPRMCLDAASFALTNIMGLVCDPIAGLVEYPCAFRNASGVVNAMISADMALAGIESLVPFDEVVESMYKVGKLLPESLRETALGGLATSPKGLEIQRKVFGN